MICDVHLTSQNIKDYESQEIIRFSAEIKNLS